MENLTHTLTAVAISQAGLNRKTRFATLAMVVGANLPDIDLVARLGGSATFLKYHRGLTHSLVGVTALGALLAAGIYAAGKKIQGKKPGPPLNGPWLLAASLIATLSHLLLDFTNSYGVRPFFPFSGRWYAWDIMFVFDPLLWLLLGAALGMPALLRLVSEEVGARKPDYRRGAIVSLAALLALWTVRDLSHRRVLGLLDSRTFGGENTLRLGAFPSPANPFVWTGVVETDSRFYVLEVNALKEDVGPDSARVYNKEEPSPALETALKTRTATIFSGFARYLWEHAEETDDGFLVTIRDLRFVSLGSHLQGFTAQVDLDKNLRVRSESFSFSGLAPRASAH